MYVTGVCRTRPGYISQLTEWHYYPKDYLLCKLDLVQWYWHGAMVLALHQVSVGQMYCTQLVQDQWVAPIVYRRKKDKRKRMKGKCPKRGSNPAIPVTIAEYELKSQLDLHVHNSNSMKNNSDLCNYNTTYPTQLSIVVRSTLLCLYLCN